MLFPCLASYLESKTVADEVFHTGVFIQTAHQIGNSVGKLLSLGGGAVQNHLSAHLFNGQASGFTHPLKNLKSKIALHAVFFGKLIRISELKKIVRSGTQMGIGSVLGIKGIASHAFVVGIGVDFLCVGRYFPVTQRSLSLLHLHVSPFDQTDFDGASAFFNPFFSPLGEFLLP